MFQSGTGAMGVMKEPPAQHAPTVRATITGAAFLSAHQLILNALSVPAMGFIIHQLGAENYAHWMTATSLLLVGGLATNLGLRASFVRQVAADRGTSREALAEQLGLRLVLSLLVVGLVLLVCKVLDYPREVLWCAAAGSAGLILTTFAKTLGDLLQARHKMKALSCVGLVAGLALTGVSVVVAWKGGGAVEIALAYLVGPFVSCVLLWAVVRKDVGVVTVRFSIARCKALLVQSRHFAAQQILFAGSGQIETLLAPWMLGMASFGLFTAGSLLANRLSILPDALCTSAFPSLVRAWSLGAKHAARVVHAYLAIGVAGGVAVASGGTLVAGMIGQILLPDQPDVVASVVRVTIWSLPLTVVEMVLGYALSAARMEKAQARLALPASVLGLLASVGLVSAFGMGGACWSLVLRPALRAVFLLPVFYRTFHATYQAAAGDQDRAHTLADATLRKAG